MASQRVKQWMNQNYPVPTVDPEWLDACCDWITDEFHLNHVTDMDQMIHHIELQLLQSDLSDSMLQGTGFPANVETVQQGRLGTHDRPILCQINDLTEIGHSAFNLQNVRQARIERADLAGLAGDEAENDGEDYAIPKYPRSMLKMVLCDGHRTIKAIEYKRLASLELGETKLGYKVLLKNVLIRDGIAFLEPGTVELKGYQSQELDAQRDAILMYGLRLRLGQDVDDESQDENGPAIVAHDRTAHRQPLRALSPEEMPRQPSDVLAEPRRHQPLTGRTPAVARANPTRQPAPTASTNTEPDPFMDDSFELDDDVLEDLDRIEREAQPQPHRSTVVRSSPLPSRPMAGSSRVAARVASGGARDMEVIAIDDDDDEDEDEADKENQVPDVVRRVRRRVDAGPSEIIDISD